MGNDSPIHFQPDVLVNSYVFKKDRSLPDLYYSQNTSERTNNMKRFILFIVVLLFSLIGTVGCMNKDETDKSKVDKTTPAPTKALSEDISTLDPVKVVTEEKAKENLNADKIDGTGNKITDKINNAPQPLKESVRDALD